MEIKIEEAVTSEIVIRLTVSKEEREILGSTLAEERTVCFLINELHQKLRIALNA